MEKEGIINNVAKQIVNDEKFTSTCEKVVEKEKAFSLACKQLGYAESFLSLAKNALETSHDAIVHGNLAKDKEHNEDLFQYYYRLINMTGEIALILDGLATGSGYFTEFNPINYEQD